MLSPHVVTENARRGVVNELLYADDLVIMRTHLKERFWNWKNALKGLKVNTRKTKLMVIRRDSSLCKHSEMAANVFYLIKSQADMFLYILLSNSLNVYSFSCINLFTSQNQ